MYQRVYDATYQILNQQLAPRIPSQDHCLREIQWWEQRDLMGHGPKYMPVCLAVRPSIHPSVHPSIHPSDHLTIYLLI
jgi:hypothetical protein